MCQIRMPSASLLLVLFKTGFSSTLFIAFWKLINSLCRQKLNANVSHIKKLKAILQKSVNNFNRFGNNGNKLGLKALRRCIQSYFKKIVYFKSKLAIFLIIIIKIYILLSQLQIWRKNQEDELKWAYIQRTNIVNRLAKFTNYSLKTDFFLHAESIEYC